MTMGTKPPTAMPVIAGVLILISEGFKLLASLGIVVAGSLFIIWDNFNAGLILPLILIPVLFFTVIAIIGGIFALQRRYWGWALAGAIITAFPFSILGLAAVVLLALSKDEFH